MTTFNHHKHTCPVKECEHNFTIQKSSTGKHGLSCGFAMDKELICLHPRHKAKWQRLMELAACELELEAELTQLGLKL